MLTNLSIRNIVKNANGFGLRWISSTTCRFSNEDNIIDPPDRAPVIPSSYTQRDGETFPVMRARLLYQSRKRGMLENGLLLSTFAAKFLADMSEKQLGLYDELINSPSNEWDLYYWASGVKPTPQKFQHEVMEMLQKHVQNSDRKCRVRQPNLY